MKNPKNNRTAKVWMDIEKIKNSIKLLEDNTGTKLKETILNDLILLQQYLKNENN